MATKYVYFFGDGKAEGKKEMKNLLGGKGANLAEMSSLGIPVPPGFTISTEVCTYYYDNKKSYPAELEKEVMEHLGKMEKIMGCKFNDKSNPLLVSVRSGARASMPGMMDTVLNLGLNDETVKGLIDRSGNERFAYDAYRRFIQMYSNVVMGMDGSILEHILESKKKEVGAEKDTDLTAQHLKDLVGVFKDKVKSELGQPFPEDPKDQLWGGIGAVFGSWNTARAVTYRKLHGYPDDWGTAVNVQAMVFGNMGDDCATGVAFTRDPATGEKVFFGEYLVNAQGEDVVAGIRTPQPVNAATKTDDSQKPLEEVMPEAYKTLEGIYKNLEKHYTDMQDIEFTIERDKLYMLQTRNGKRTAHAAVKIAVDMVKEGLIDEKTAVLRVEPGALDQLLHPRIDPKAPKEVLAKGLPASPGAACGQIVFSADDAETWAADKKDVILVRHETSPEDVGGMSVSKGILTALGGMTSHAAVVARGMGTCCVAGCGALNIDLKGKTVTVAGKTLKEGDVITLNGSSGEVMNGQVATIEGGLDDNFAQLMVWADKYRKLGVRTNAETPRDSKVARTFGAEGIGLARTEHMFFEGDRIDFVREMILSDNLEDRVKAVAKLLPFQKEDFLGIFREMKDLPVTIRLLDPPLHEFLPQLPAQEKEVKELSKQMGVSEKRLADRIRYLHELNPMLGHRGCRLTVTYPEICRMQARAIMEAACELTKEGIKVLPEIMIPLVALEEELSMIREWVVDECTKVQDEMGVKLEYLVGTMIELPRACLVADKIAEHAQFFSFGTNDLTQTTYGLSRDDAGKFLPEYVDKKIMPCDPFVSIDIDGVGQLVDMGVKKGRSTNSNLKVGICGEHGGDPASVKFCHKVGLNYVSCSPYRVPIARLAAAQAALEE